MLIVSEIISARKTMQIGPETAEMLALKFPHSCHLIPMLEEACEEVEVKGKGWGRLCIDSQGLNKYGKLLIKFIDIQRRKFFGKEE